MYSIENDYPCPDLLFHKFFRPCICIFPFSQQQKNHLPAWSVSEPRPGGGETKFFLNMA